jgi:transcriptional regulator CtsR
MTYFTISIDDPDALDAIQHIIDTNGTGEKPEDVIAGLLVPQLVAMREAQLMNAAPKPDDYPPLAAFKDRQTEKIKPQSDIAPEPSPVVLVLP